jgi:hypothetical protein
MYFSQNGRPGFIFIKNKSYSSVVYFSVWTFSLVKGRGMKLTTFLQLVYVENLWGYIFTSPANFNKIISTIS